MDRAKDLAIEQISLCWLAELIYAAVELCKQLKTV